MESKICSKCKIVKAAVEFAKRKDTKSGLRSHCKLCVSNNELYKNTAKLTGKINYQNNKEKRKKYLEENKEILKTKRKERNAREDVKLKQKEYVEKNKDKMRKYKYNYNNIYQKNRRLIDPKFKIACNLRGRLRDALNGKNKSAKTMELLDCEPEFLKLYLELQFTPQMTWDNYGSYWHIDHIKPCASFDLMNPEHQKQCFHWSNLQPLEAIENIRKGAKLNWNNNE
ncbi:Hypothetical protein PACV_243 [Pacmanvirus A23]|uniref:endonuclease VII n=1 Tax=Pacmanvirus A23 TaxID=1932881 RepID=UPI000A092AE3|nr:endonuclease VII [Pacmanvirus A23]SIP85958.1 Hypothetical protein PACV_243 [Pacmanvirus A23]